jgi:hypothetical protein
VLDFMKRTTMAKHDPAAALKRHRPGWPNGWRHPKGQESLQGARPFRNPSFARCIAKRGTAEPELRRTEPRQVSRSGAVLNGLGPWRWRSGPLIMILILPLLPLQTLLRNPAVGQ